MKRVGILYHPKIEKAKAFSQELEKFLKASDILPWTCSAWEEDKAKPQIADSELMLSIGGDGTILRTVRAVIPHAVPIVGINLGNLGFMTELKADEAFEKLPRLLDGDGWIEERSMLEAEVLSQAKVFNVLNDVFVGRRNSARLVQIETKVDGEVLATYRADGVIVATATGSTSYSLAAGGPILYPQAKEIIFKPVCPHLALDRAVVLPAEAEIQIKVTTTHEAMLSIDGQVEMPLRSGDEVKVKRSLHVARFLRIRPKAYFYSYLELRLKGKGSV
ncbi:MAG: NAD(+)/NADH kinase [Chloroflexi bacterium]|nr:NAD(+)/NADH kinase [Chloroflexota bacterium]MBL7061235.1 NAD(+)/NADH kinase [Dehalococcoidia bacterium]